MKWLAPILCCLFLTGCGMLPARIKAGPVSVTGVKDAGKPATLATSEAGTVIPLPEGSRVTVTKYEPVAATPMAPAQPAKEVTEIAPSGPTEYHKTESTVKADTGTVDTSVRKHQIDVEDRRWLLWAAIVCGIAGVVLKSMLPGWGGLSNGLLIGAALAFGAWKLSDIPAWIWAAVIIVMVAMAAGYKRAEWDKDGDGVPDFLQKPKQPPQ